ncbi:MAG: hypothetical protein HY873_00925, partial [Chloroflexi bacterium]|nr:hypothetical protein [Chloroflexota bacterium]
MKIWVVVFAAVVFAAVVLAASACRDSDDNGSATPSATVATESTNTPAATATSALPAIDVEADNYTTEAAYPQLTFDRMIEIATIPGDRDHAVVITQSGTAWRFSAADPSEAPTVFLDIQDRIIPGAGNEEGLLGIAFPPDFQQTRRFYVAYSGGPARQNILS